MGKIIETIIRLNNGLWRRFRNSYYKSAFHSCGPELQVDKGAHIINPGQISAGRHLVINRDVVLQGTKGGRIIMGDNVTLSYSAKIITANLVIPERIHVYKDVIIGNNVWISSNVVVLPGVVISDNVIVAAGAVVSSNLESGFVYGGIPAKKIKAL